MLTFSLILVLSNKNYIGKILFKNIIIQYIGKISYSFYLIHAVVLILLDSFYPLLVSSGIYFKNSWECYMLYVFLIVIMISSLTYFFIEKPFVNLGKK